MDGLPFYYPQSIRCRVERATGKRRKDLVSAFGGYLFAAGKPAVEWCIDHPDLVECRLKENRAGQLGRDLLMVEASLKEHPEMHSGEIDGPGIKVRVIAGPWLGFEGVTEKIDHGPQGTRVHFPIETLGRMVPLELPYCQLERID